MCGGYTIRLDPSKSIRLKTFAPQGKWQPMYNARPGEILPVVTLEQPKLFTLGLWNFIPHWMKFPKGKGVINARAESLLEKPYFKSSFQHFRCIVPADGFYEWQRTATTKQPYFFHRTNDQPFAFAGLYDVSPGEKKQIGFTIITTTPNAKVKTIHNRMPVILDDAQEEEWLSPKANPADLMLFLDPYPAEQMALFPVSLRVNNPRDKSPDVLERANLV